MTYRKVYLLFDEKSTPVIYKQRIAYVVGHELAHQWFGNEANSCPIFFFKSYLFTSCTIKLLFVYFIIHVLVLATFAHMC